MDLDRSLDDLIKQKKNKPKRNLPERKQKQNKNNLNIHTKAKIKKTTILNTGKSNIISRLVSETIYFTYFILD